MAERKQATWSRRAILGGVLVLLVGWASGTFKTHWGTVFSSSLQGSASEVEPNETIEQATPISLPGQRTGSIRYGDASQVEYRYQNGPVDRIEDLFRFEVPKGAAQPVNVALSFDNAAVDLDLFLFQLQDPTTLNALGVSNGMTTTERILPIPTLPPGIYFVGVSVFDDPKNQGVVQYKLDLAVGTVPPAPVISEVTPASVEAGSGPFSLRVRGENFIEGKSVVRWNGNARATTYLQPGELLAYLSAADTAAQGTALVTVENPAGDGGGSLPVRFSILAPGQPSIEEEPNDQPDQANLLTVPGKRAGRVSLSDAGGVRISLGVGLTDTIEDLFAIRLLEESRLQLTLTGESAEAGTALYLLSEGATTGQVTVLGSSRRQGTRQQVTTPSRLPSGRYLVGVSSVAGSTGYTLEAAVPGSRLLQVETASAAPDSRVSVPLTFLAEGDEAGMTFSLAFDPTILGSPTWVADPAQPTARVRLDSSLLAQGLLGVEYRLAEGGSLPPGWQTLGSLNFAIRQGETRRTTPIELDDRPLVRTLYDRQLRAVQGGYASGSVIIVQGMEADMVPRPYGDGNQSVTIADWAQVGRFVANLDSTIDGSEYQRTDTAPKSSRGDGRLTIADWVQAGRYAAGLEEPLSAGGPTGPAPTVATLTTASSFTKEVSHQGAAEEWLQQGLQQETRRTLQIPVTRFERDRENELPIELIAEGNENALGFSLNFDTTQLTFQRATLGRDGSSAVLNVNLSRLVEGRVGLALALPSGQSFGAGTRQVVRIVFTVPSTNSVDASTISFGDLPIIREVVNAEASVLPALYQAGEVRFDPPLEQLPVLSRVVPERLLVGAVERSIRLEGRNFRIGTVARIGGEPRQTRFIDPTVLGVDLVPNDLAEAGALDLTVLNPAPGGGLSNVLSLTVENRLPVITRIVPEVVGVSPVGLTLSVDGEHFVRGVYGVVDGATRPTTYISPTRLSLQLQPGDLSRTVNLAIRIVAPPPGGGESNERTLSVRPPNPLPRLLQISPTTVEAESDGLTLTVTGSNFVEDSSVTINGARLPTLFRSATELTAEVARERIPRPGTALIAVTNPTPGGGNSNSALLTITVPRNPVPVVTSLSPSTILAGSARISVTVRGSGFVESSVVQINGLAQMTSYRQRSELVVEVPAELLVAADDLSVQVVNPAPGGGASGVIPLMIVNPVPVLARVTPAWVVEGSSSQTLTLVGSGLTPDSRVLIDGVTRAIQFQSATQITTQLSANELVNARTLTVEIRNPTPGGGTSNRLTFEVRRPNPLPRIQAIRPAEVPVGAPTFLLVVEGTRFISDSLIQINRQSKRTEFVSDTILVAEVSAAEVERAGELMITVQNPAPGGGDSNSMVLQVLYPTPRLTSITPASVTAGATDTEVLVFGEGFSSATTLRLQGTALPVTRTSSSQLVLQVPARLIANGGSLTLVVTNPSPGGGSSNPLTLTVVNPTPAVTRFRTVGLEANVESFRVVLEGSGFVPGSLVRVKGQDRPTTWESNQQISALLPISDIESDGTLTLAVVNPAPGGGNSSLVVQQVGFPAPELTSVTPSQALVGGSPFTLMLLGRNFQPFSVVYWNGTPRSTDYRSGTELQVTVTSADLRQAGNASLTVRTQGPGGGISGPVNLAILNPTPALTRISPAMSIVGSASVDLVLEGSGFVSQSSVIWNGASRPATFVSVSQLQLRLAPSDLALVGSIPVAVVSPGPGGGSSNVLTFLVEPRPNPVPMIGRMSPSSVVAGDPSLTVEITGTGFIPGSTLLWQGTPRSFTYHSETRLTTTLSADELLVPGNFTVVVVNPAPGGGSSSAVNWTVDPKPINCQTVCLQSADYYLNNSTSWPSGFIWIGRFTHSTRYSRLTIRRALEANVTLQEQLTRQFSAAQLSVLAGGNSPGISNSSLNCYQVSFDPIQLSTGVSVSRTTSLSDLFNWTRTALVNNVVEDQQALLPLFEELNGNNPQSKCR
ncbi:MAG: PPC domain-containing protein [Blastocatellia bacterium]